MNELVSDGAFQALCTECPVDSEVPVLERVFSPCMLIDAKAFAHVLIRHLHRSGTG